MAGHSKWANIRFRKAAQDARRGKQFTRLIREVAIAARGGADPCSNPRLRTAVDKALGANVTRDAIDRAIRRGSGELGGAAYEEVRYEGYGPGGVAFLVECATDNRNRTVGEVRHAFGKHGGNLGAEGSVAYLFTRTGLFVFPPRADDEKIMEEAISAGAEDVEIDDDGSVEVLAAPERFEAIRGALHDAGLEPGIAEIVQRPATGTELAGEDADRIEKLVEALEELDDVQAVYTNAVFTDR